MKTTKEAFKAYRDWHRYILGSHPKLPKGFKRATLVAYAFAMATHGTNGLGCYAGDELIAEELEIYHYERVSGYRHLALDLGWFVRTGERQGRAEVLDIAIPSVTESPNGRQAPEAPAEDGKHTGNRPYDDCPVCKDLIRQIRSGELELTPSELDKIHASGRQEAITPLTGVIDLGRLPP